MKRNPGRSSTSAASGFVLLSLAGCADFEAVGSANYLTVTPRYDKDTCGSTTAAVANGACRVTLDLNFPSGSDALENIKLRTSVGTLTSSQGTVDGSGVTIVTSAHGENGKQENVAAITAPLQSMSAEVTATSGGLVFSKPIHFDVQDPSRIELLATLRTFKTNSGRATDLTLNVTSDAGSPSTGTKLYVACCCADRMADPPSAEIVECSRLLSVPSALTTTTAEPNKVQLEARLTAEGDNYLAEAVTTTDSLSIYVVASNDPNFQCKGSAPPTLAAPSDVVELRLIREPAKAE